MNVRIKHEGTFITSHVISYEREHKICTGIGTLSVVIDGNVGRDFVPWDTVDIYENGSFQVRYYISDVTTEQPHGTITLECQDRSKRVIDYFIPDQYTIDYPSYTRYWIEKFLTEAGVTYQFRTESQGNLIPNYTSLGLQPAYEQILNLLQLSGWYMFFDGNGKAIIGTLDTDLATVRATFSKHSILDVKKVSDDKMLRNRAVVWGAYDAFRNESAYADISTHTRWNYDKRDYRTIVVSNSNIPTKASAYGIANKLLKEFARITVEKHVTLVGTPNINLGDLVKIKSNVFSGSGLITTFGVSMSRDGLVTNIVLDERCPRLFGFFDFGDYVYVGTYGSGIWRKHIKFDPTWYDFSTGLTQLGITDLHINNDMFGAIGASGEMFYAESSDGSWIPYPISYLESSVSSDYTPTISGVVPSGQEMTAFSGIMGRAVIIDKITNTIKYGIDTYSGLNYGDYFLMSSGMFGSGGAATAVSGISLDGVTLSGHRSWIVEYDPFTTQSGVYPIAYSGSFDFLVVDLENDGVNDYVSVRGNQIEVIPSTTAGYNLGKHNSQRADFTQDSTTRTSFAPLSTLVGKIIKKTLVSSSSYSGITVFDNEANGETEVLWSSGGLHRWKIARDPITHILTQTTVNSASISPDGTSMGIVKVSADVYRHFFVSSTSTSTVQYFSYREWNVATNTVSSEVIISSASIPQPSPGLSYVFSDFITIEQKFHWVWSKIRSNNFGFYDGGRDNYIEIYDHTVDLATLAGTSGLRARFDFHTGDSAIFGPRQDWHIDLLGSASQIVSLYQKGNQTYGVGFISEFSDPSSGGDYVRNNWIITSNDAETFNLELMQTTDNGSDSDFVYSVPAFDSNGAAGADRVQLTGEGFVAYIRGSNNAAILFNTDSVNFDTWTTVPKQLDARNITPIFGTTDSYYIAYYDSDWHFVDKSTFAVVSTLVVPTDFTNLAPFRTVSSVTGRYYWYAENALSETTIFESSTTGMVEQIQDAQIPNFSILAGSRFIVGNFFVAMGTNLVAMYVNNYENAPTAVPGYMVLQRDGTDFHLIQESLLPIRLDISNSSPLVTALDKENTFQSQFIFGNELQTVVTMPFDTPPSGVNDYRYTMMDMPLNVTISGVVTSGIETPSGLAANKLLLYVKESGVFFTPVDSLASGFLPLFTIPSGEASRIETSNFVSSGQYIFVTTSGDIPDFFQKEPSNVYFDSYSGLPNVRATIIRVDDRF